MIPLMRPIFDAEMREAMIYAVENEHYVMGESVFKFEEEFAQYCGVTEAISVSSGTAALHLALMALGVKSGARVATTSFSFVATSNAIIHAGGVPVFGDVDPSTGNIDAGNLSLKGCRGVVPVHLYGNPCDMDEVCEKASEEGAFVVEDACQAHGAEYKGKKTGSICDVGCFSFYSSKNMTVCGDGGMAVTNNQDLAKKIRMLRDCGRISKYVHEEIGFTQRLNTLNAAIGRIQLRRLDSWNEERRRLAELYRKQLPKEIQLADQKDRKSVYHLFVVKVDRRDEALKYLNGKEIGAAVQYPLPIHLQPAYRRLYGYSEGAFPASEMLAKRVLSLPIFIGMKDDEVKLVCEELKRFYGW